MNERTINHIFQAVLVAVALWVGSSINDLNKNVSVIIEKTTSHEKRLDNIEKRVYK